MTSSAKILKLGSYYMIGEVAIALSGFISFPIFTRLLTKEEYGIMNIISVTLGLVATFSSAGLRHASQRFYHHYEKRNQLSSFYTTVLVSSCAFAILGTGSFVALGVLLSYAGVLLDNTRSIILVASGLILARVMMNMIGSLYRIREEAAIYSIFSVLTKYVGMMLSIALISYYFHNLYGFFVGLSIGEVLILLLLIAHMVKHFGWPKSAFSPAIFKETLAYGFPFIIASLAAVVLSMGDRYLIGFFLNVESVATYSVAYNLCMYLSGTLITVFELVFIPSIMKLWNNGNPDSVRKQVENTLKIYCLVALPIIFGTTAVGNQLVVILAGEKYLSSSHLIPYILAGEMLKGLFTFLAIGVQFSKNTGILASVNWSVALVNILSNLLLIPRVGLLGAAISTIISYILLVMLGAIRSSKYFKLSIPFLHILKYAACSFLMYAGLLILTWYAHLNLVILITLGALIYISLLLLFDPDIRRFAVNIRFC
ncbi:MAG: oligosaccharide flippase family protein [Anaerolineaceae bacterium]